MNFGPQDGQNSTHLRRADTDMTIQQVMAHLNILNRVLEQTLKEEKIQMMQVLHVAPKAFCKSGVVLIELSNWLSTREIYTET